MSLIFRGDKTSPITPAEYDANLQYLLDSIKGLDGLENPTADRLLAWDQSAGGLGFFGLGAGLAFDGETLRADADWLDGRYYTQAALLAILAGYYDQGEVDALLAAKVGKLAANKTVNLTPSMSAAEVQAAIDAEPRDLGGHVLTFQFADGTYGGIIVRGFRNGTVRIMGNASDNTAAESKSVVISDSAPVIVEDCFCNVSIYYIRCSTSGMSASTDYGVLISRCVAAQCVYCACVGDTTSYGRGFRASNSIVTITGCVVGNYQHGICCEIGMLYSATNTIGTTQPVYGLRAETAGVIGKYSTQPTGSTSNELILRGGVIR